VAATDTVVVLKRDDCNAEPLNKWGELSGLVGGATQTWGTISGGESYPQIDGRPASGYERTLTQVDGAEERAELGHNSQASVYRTEPSWTFWRFYEGETNRIGLSLLIPASGGIPLNPGTWQIVTQFKQTGASNVSGDTPVLSLHLDNGKFSIWQSTNNRWSNNNSASIYEFPFTVATNTRYRTIWDITFSQDSAIGSVELTILDGATAYYSGRLATYTLKAEVGPPPDYSTTTGGGTNQANGESVPSHMRVGAYHNPSVAAGAIKISNIQIGVVVPDSSPPSVSEKAPPVEVVAVTPDGYRRRWGYDEPDAENVPDGLSFSSSMPGGADEISATLRRDPAAGYRDLARFTELRVGRSGGRTMDFRIEETPWRSGYERSVEVRGRGYRSALEDRQDARAIFVNRSVSDWNLSAPYARAALLYALGLRMYDPPQTAWAGDGAAIEIGFRGPFNTSTAYRRSEAFFDAQGIALGDLYFDLDAMTTPGTAAASFTAGLVRDTAYWSTSGSATSANLAAGTAAGYLSALASPWELDGTEVAASFQMVATAAGTAEKDSVLRAAKVAVYGDHGLTRYGGPPGGFYTGQLVEWIADHLSPLTAGEVDLGTFLHVHASYIDPTTPLAMIEDLVRYEPLYDWFAFDREIHFRRRGTYGKRWRARVGEADLSTTGETVERLYNEVAVKVDDPALSEGVIVGPVGSGHRYTDSRLSDSDPSNPATAAGVTRRALLDIGEGTLAGAIEIGARFLEETRAMDTSGDATLVGLVSDDAGIAWPVDEVRAGDEIAFTDAADTSYRRIVSTNYDGDAQTNSLSLDAPPETMDALLARLGARLIPLG